MMDYGRLSAFMVGATAAMVIATHLWCWAYAVISRLSLYWRLDRLRKQLGIDDAEEEAMDRRRAVAPTYMTWEQAMADFRGGVPIDDVLDRLNGKFPPKAADIQMGCPGEPSALSLQVLGPVIYEIALLTCFLGFISPTPEMVEVLLKNAQRRAKSGAQVADVKGGAGIAGGNGPKGAVGS